MRMDVHFCGHVQGVGFRYTTLSIASGYDVAGFVQNLPDGQVHLVAEGAEPVLNDFLSAVEQRMAGAIRETHVDRGPATGQFERFEILY